MRAPAFRTTLVVFALLFCGQTYAKRPNIVLILTDDQDAVMGGDQHMPNLKKYIADVGANFTDFIANFAVCCPSRTAILTGKCSHNSGVVSAGDYPLGGYPRFQEMGLETQTAPVFLQQEGYRTGLIGKYLNMYTSRDGFHVPPGWDTWFAFTSPQAAQFMGLPDYYNYTISRQGQLVDYGDKEEDYSTDVLTGQAVEFIHAAAEDHRPFFLYLTPYACHRPHVPAPRHLGTLKGLKVPRTPAYNESSENIAKKVSFVRDLPPIDHDTARALDFEYQTRAETLLAVDDMIEAVVQALDDVGQTDNTYIFYTADNGFKLGYHRISGKQSAYENDVRLPFYVRGPGVPKGVVLPHLAGNIDLTPTWLELAGVKDPLAPHRDGISLAPILRSEPESLADPDRHRVAFIIEKPTAYGSLPEDRHVSILVPVQDPENDVFKDLRPVLLPDGTWPKEVLEWEWQGKHFNEKKASQAASAQDFYYGLEKTAGFNIYFNLTREQGIPVEAVVRGLNEDFPTAYYGLRYSARGQKFKYIEYPGGFELYDLVADPHEVNNIFETAPPALVASLQDTLSLLKVCRGSNCRVKNINVLARGLQWQDAPRSHEVLEL